GQVCSVGNASGVFHGAEIAVTVNCEVAGGGSGIGGTAAGIVATEQPLQLINIENGDIITLTANGAYTFPAHVSSGVDYTVQVLQNPTAPNQTCTVANATGTMADPDAAVTNIDITCTTNTYGAAGNLVGLS